MKIRAVLKTVGAVLLFAGAVLSFLTSFLIGSRSVDEYMRFSSETARLECIGEAFYDPVSDLIFVFCENGCHANVYGTDGAFRYAFAMPHQGWASWEICFSDGVLTFSGDGGATVFRIDAASGTLLEESEDETPAEDEPVSEGRKLEKSAVSVFFTNGAGERIAIVRKSPFVRLLSPTFFFHVGLVGGLLSAAVALTERKKAAERPARTRTPGAFRAALREHFAVSFHGTASGRAGVLLWMTRISCAVFLVFSLLCCLLAAFGISISVGMLPLAIWFIVFGVVLHNVCDAAADAAELAVLSSWLINFWATFLFALLSSGLISTVILTVSGASV